MNTYMYIHLNYIAYTTICVLLLIFYIYNINNNIHIIVYAI